MGTYTNYSKLEVDGTISSSVQGELIGTFTSMPSASARNEGKTIYYTGATSGNYVQNTFYTCTKSGSTYSWTSASPKQVSVDSALSETSTNPVQNKVIATALKGYATKDDIATVYKPKGSVASTSLPTNPRVGDVYNLTDNSSYGPAGTNVVYTEDGTWDALAGIVDISGKQDKISAGTGISLSGNTVSLATSGVTAGTKGGATAVPVITVDAYGRITSISTSTIYPPTTVGTSGQIWVSDGSGAGTWQSKDTAPASGSTNAITSGAVHTALAGKQNNLSFDSTPTQNSSNPVTSGGVYNALAGKQPNLTFDSAPKSGSSNPVTSGGIYTAIEAKQSKLTFDSTPTSGSNNPVTSGGIFSAINEIASSSSGLLIFPPSFIGTATVTIVDPFGDTIINSQTISGNIPLENGYYNVTVNQFNSSVTKKVSVHGPTHIVLDTVTWTIGVSGIKSMNLNGTSVPVGDIVILKSENTVEATLGFGEIVSGMPFSTKVTISCAQNGTLAPTNTDFISLNTSGTLTIPRTGKYEVWAVGGGGGGGRGSGFTWNSAKKFVLGGAGGDGGKGGVIKAMYVDFNEGDTVELTAGAGGTGATTSSAKSTAGGTTIFGTFMSCAGGAGGSNNGSPGSSQARSDGGAGGDGSNSTNIVLFGQSYAYGTGGAKATNLSSRNHGKASGVPSDCAFPGAGRGGDSGLGYSSVYYSNIASGSTKTAQGGLGGSGGYALGTLGVGGNGGRGKNVTVDRNGTRTEESGTAHHGKDGNAGGIQIRMVFA